MRISDWSSDVCSSDLLVILLGRTKPSPRMNSPRIISIDSFFLNITRGLAGQRTHRINDLVRCILGKDGFLTRSQSLHRRTSTQPKSTHCCNHNSFTHRHPPSSCIYPPPRPRKHREKL